MTDFLPFGKKSLLFNRQSSLFLIIFHLFIIFYFLFILFFFYLINLLFLYGFYLCFRQSSLFCQKRMKESTFFA